MQNELDGQELGKLYEHGYNLVVSKYAFLFPQDLREKLLGAL